MNDTDADKIDLCDSCFKVFENEKVAASSESDLFTNKNVPHSISKSNLITQQHEDPEISALFQKTVDENGLSESRKEILARKMKLPPFHQKRRNLRKKSA